MADPTLEEEVRSWRVMLFGDENNTPSTENVVSVDLIEYHVINLIRAAVATETKRWMIGPVDDPVIVRRMIEDRAKTEEQERCAKAEPLHVRCTICASIEGEPCWDTVNNHPASGVHRIRFAAAIRRGVEEW